VSLGTLEYAHLSSLVCVGENGVYGRCSVVSKTYYAKTAHCFRGRFRPFDETHSVTRHVMMFGYELSIFA